MRRLAIAGALLVLGSPLLPAATPALTILHTSDLRWLRKARGLFTAAHYAGTDPVADHVLTLKPDDKIKNDATSLQQKLEAAKIVMPRQVGEEDKLFGSVTSMDIEQALHSQGFAINRKQIQLPEPIKTLGLHEVPVKIHPEVVAKVRVNVTKQA